ncbi:MAG TPA: sulfite exporter TauE/SafE family protein [Micavibrio sp.]|jgi:hypothetical protein|nr:sulfite exporter TauE/SafE family protein [Pseudomonadota bacterium]HIF26180.1 sulfite exporter TauE/SafE family protein [Micavibrio sp.]HIL28929.1 sulfite exporter TauE/SafE family protein [Micavibrio sp.]
MQIYLPIAEMTVPAESILLLGTFVGFLSGLFGVGGGFLTTPFLIFMGLPPGIAVGTQSNQLVAASLSGVLAHFKKGNVDFKLGGVMLVGSLLGSVIGVSLFKLLKHMGQIEFVIPLLYVFLLGSMGLMMFYESLSSMLKKKDVEGDESSKLMHHKFFTSLPYKMRFPRSKLYVSALVPGAIGFVGGLLVSIMGIGGGFLLVPAMIYILGMPTILVAGTSLFQIMITTIFATIMQAVTNHTVDLVLAAMLIFGGVVGAQFGVRFSRKLKGSYARFLLASMLLIVCFKLAGDLFIAPTELYSTEVN